MMKKVIIVVLGLVLALFLAGASLAANPAAKEQVTCPVMGGKINKNLYADDKGQRVYFCCPGCIESFKKDPERYLKKLEEQRTTP